MSSENHGERKLLKSWQVLALGNKKQIGDGGIFLKFFSSVISYSYHSHFLIYLIFHLHRFR